jgi:hypothetical protein
LVGVESSPATQDARRRRALDPVRPRSTERVSMFYVVLLVVAAALLLALFFVRGRTNA